MEKHNKLVGMKHRDVIFTGPPRKEEFVLK